jgi:predicted membrane metal-binding protein
MISRAICFFRGSARPALPRRADALVQRLRDAIDARIRAVLPGDEGAIAAMLIDGKRDVIVPNVYDALFVSGIGHVLSISGYHMAVVAGLIFFMVRAFFALIPGLADRAPINGRRSPRLPSPAFISFCPATRWRRSVHLS